MKYLPGEEEIQYHLARGILMGIEGHPMAGLKHLVFSDGRRVSVGRGYGVRQLAQVFNYHAGSLNDAIRNQDIYYGVDGLGILEWVLPADEWEGKELLVGEEEWLPAEEFPRNESSI